LQNVLADFIVSGGMCALMFAMGLTLTRDDFRRISRTPVPTFVGTVLQLVVMPLIGISIARAFDLPPLLTAGLVVLSACPGGMFSNMFIHVARGHTALSITLTATSTLVTLFTLPIWVRLALSRADGVQADVEMPILETALRLAMLTILPIGLGMVTRAQRPSTVRWETWLSRMSVVLICVGAGIDGADRPEPPSAEFFQSVVPVAWYALASVTAGTLIPALFRISARDGVTIAVEIVVKNTLLGIVLLTQTVDFVAVVPLLVYMMIQTPAGILLLVAWRMLARRGHFAPVPTPLTSPVTAEKDAESISRT
jgi:bile acid:Na+ symporter, BASS family